MLPSSGSPPSKTSEIERASGGGSSPVLDLSLGDGELLSLAVPVTFIILTEYVVGHLDHYFSRGIGHCSGGQCKKRLRERCLLHLDVKVVGSTEQPSKAFCGLSAQQLRHMLREGCRRQWGVEPLQILQHGRSDGHLVERFAHDLYRKPVRQSLFEQRIPLGSHAFKRGGCSLQQCSDFVQASTFERHCHNSVANILVAMQVEALPCGEIAQLEELAVTGTELARHESRPEQARTCHVVASTIASTARDRKPAAASRSRQAAAATAVRAPRHVAHQRQRGARAPLLRHRRGAPARMQRRTRSSARAAGRAAGCDGWDSRRVQHCSCRTDRGVRRGRRASDAAGQPAWAEPEPAQRAGRTGAHRRTRPLRPPAAHARCARNPHATLCIQPATLCIQEVVPGLWIAPVFPVETRAWNPNPNPNPNSNPNPNPNPNPKPNPNPNPNPNQVETRAWLEAARVTHVVDATGGWRRVASALDLVRVGVWVADPNPNPVPSPNPMVRVGVW
eukprot:scaffold62361_cov61-Phaeocystis_antarctica.AAC.2